VRLFLTNPTDGHGQHGDTVTAPLPAALGPLPRLAALITSPRQRRSAPCTGRPVALHDDLQGTVTNLLSSSDLDQVSPLLLGTRISSLFSYVYFCLFSLFSSLFRENLCKYFCNINLKNI
jgi:hypothetical protein